MGRKGSFLGVWVANERALDEGVGCSSEGEGRGWGDRSVSFE